MLLGATPQHGRFRNSAVPPSASIGRFPCHWRAGPLRSEIISSLWPMEYGPQ